MENMDANKVSQEIFTLEEAQQIKPIMQEFMTAYVENKDKEIGEWLPAMLQSSLNISLEEAQEMTGQLVDTVRFNEESAKSLAEAKSRGMTREAWVSKLVLEETKDLPSKEQEKQLQEICSTLMEENGFLSEEESEQEEK